MDNEITLTKQQLNAIEMLKKNKLSLLIGGPGTGKTTTTKAMIDWALSEGLSILQAAPTGKAAKRMAEATDFYSSTIHSMLGCQFEEGRFVFVHNKTNPLNADLIILDETSMLTNNLMARVLEAIDTDRTKLLLIGDKDQLPSIGAGAILRDLISCDTIPCVELDIIHRNSGEIIKACHGIKNGRIYAPHRKLDLLAESPINLVHVERHSPEETLAMIDRLTCQLLPEKYGYDPIEDIQIISPVNKKGELSCESINNLLKAELNPLKVSGKDRPMFCQGDKVINTKNDKAFLTNGASTAIVNGDIGIIKKISDKHLVVLFSFPDREVSLLKSEQNLLHAYCITCHRFQGSEAPVIIIPVHAQFNFFLSNAWIYTAISRAKDICITVGSFNTVQRAIENRRPNDRITMLEEKILEII